jgi:predicted RNA-binding protein
MPKDVTQYWIAVASKDHVLRGVEGGFMQANHGKLAPLKRTKPGDWVLFYSPKQSLDGTEKYQAFTALGQIRDEPIYQVTISDNFEPHRRHIAFTAGKDVSILPLIDRLDFIQNKKSWGYTFRFGFFEIDRQAFELIRDEMLI